MAENLIILFGLRLANGMDGSSSKIILLTAFSQRLIDLETISQELQGAW
jgi:hypothetical protein